MPDSWSKSDVLAVINRYWGFDTLRPQQEQAIAAGLDGRDSLVVMPTGGGKSLCYQVPPLLLNKVSVVVSPLISLMKDQVDGLTANGYQAVALNSNISPKEQREIEDALEADQFRLLFVAPERLLSSRFMSLMSRLRVRSFSIDEAHCISQWGHDFRPEYRRLLELRERFPTASFHAYTATATQRVREDIIEQLRLKDPAVLVGKFDRPNLVYRVLPRMDLVGQIREVLARHEDQAAIVYCISRRDTESVAAALKASGVDARAYHAGLDPNQRNRVQGDFSREKLNVVVATVAFGMGIDRSNVRCVIHAAMPKSIEHYQQETGRAGRDGLDADCVMLYSQGDSVRWKKLFDMSAADEGRSIEDVNPQTELLKGMQQFSATAVCRHRMLSEYFGQALDGDGCGACDVCLNELESDPESQTIAKKVISCILRMRQPFGAGQVADVLKGANTEMVRKYRHEELSTYGLLKELPKKTIQNYVYQLIDQGAIGRTDDEFPVVQINDVSQLVLKDKRQVCLFTPKTKVSRTKSEAQSWEGVDRALFEHLRKLRRQIADERAVPPFVIFGDVTLMELARVRPSSRDSLINVRGIGSQKLADLGQIILEEIAVYCNEKGLTQDAARGTSPGDIPTGPVVISGTKKTAFDLFSQKYDVEAVVEATGRAKSTVWGYLVEWVEHARPRDVSRWVDDLTYERITQAAAKVDTDRLKPVYDLLEEQVPYEQIRITLSHLRATADSDAVSRKV